MPSAKPYMVQEDGKKIVHILRKNLSDGSFAVAMFNFGETYENAEVYLDEVSAVRDLWAKKHMENTDKLSIYMPPHTVRIFKVSKK